VVASKNWEKPQSFLDGRRKKGESELKRNQDVDEDRANQAQTQVSAGEKGRWRKEFPVGRKAESRVNIKRCGPGERRL